MTANEDRHSLAQLDQSVGVLLAASDTRSHALYACTTLTALVVIASMGTTTDVTVRAPMEFLPGLARQTLRSSGDGVVERINASLGAVVRAGDTLAALTSRAQQQVHSSAVMRLHEQLDRRADLKVAVAFDFVDTSTQRPQFRVPTSRASFQTAAVEWRLGTEQLVRATEVLDRAMKLRARGFAVPAELEAAQHEVSRARADRDLALERRRAAWSEELASTEQQIVVLKRDSTESAIAESARYTIAPIAGTVEDLAPISPGSTLRAGDPIATISPDGDIIAEAYVPPKDVSYIHKGMPARLIIEGFDVQTWGAMEATVISVASDVTVMNNQPVFRVRLKPNAEELRRAADGRKARLTKGLRAQARFIVGRRRIADVLRHRMSDWLDPSSPQ